MPISGLCKPLDETRAMINDSNGRDFEPARLPFGSRFEFQRKQVENSDVEVDHRENKNEESLGLIRVINENDDVHNPLLLNNSSMIVRVIVTSSSSSSRSTSSSSEIVETDSNDHQHEHVHFSVAEDNEKPPFISTSVSPTVTDIPPYQNQETEIGNADKLELKKLPSAQEREPVQDIFFPFSYRAFSHDSSSSSSTFSSTATSSFSHHHRGDHPVTIFSSQPSHFQPDRDRDQQRRRFTRVRQLERRKALVQRQTEESAVEETKRRLELLSSKLDRSSKIISPSPSKIAVSVAVTKSVAASGPKSNGNDKYKNVSGGGAIGASGHTITPYLQLQTEKIHGPQTSPFAPSPTLKSSFSARSMGEHRNATSRNSPFSSLFETSASRRQRPTQRRNKVRTRTVSSEIGYPSSSTKLNSFTTPTTTPRPKTTNINWQEPAKLWGEPAQIWGEPAKVWGEPERVWGEPAKVWGESETTWGKQSKGRNDNHELMQSDQPVAESGDKDVETTIPQGSFVILGDDETEGDSIDGDLGRPLMLHHFTINNAGNKKEEKSKSVSVSTSVSSSVSSNGPTSRKVQGFQDHQAQASQPHSHHHQYHFQHHQVLIGNKKPEPPVASTNVSGNSENDQHDQQEKKGKKFGYVIEGANVRKYRVEERTPDGYIVGEYGVLNNQNAFLRGVRYTADGTINPRLIHEALLKFLSLRR